MLRAVNNLFLYMVNWFNFYILHIINLVMYHNLFNMLLKTKSIHIVYLFNIKFIYLYCNESHVAIIHSCSNET